MSMTHTERTFQKAIAALNSRNMFDAEQLLRKVLENQPDHVAALNLLTIVLMSMERFLEAEEFIAKAVRLNQSSDVSYYNYGLILKRLNKPKQALERFDSALRLNARIPETWNNRSNNIQ